MIRQVQIKRKTNETLVDCTINLDGKGLYKIDTGVGFFNHMLELFSKHSLIDVSLLVKGDLEVDCHHSIEDAGIVLGQAIKKALGDKKSIKRYGSFTVPMDEALARVNIDLSMRPYLVFNGEFSKEKVGDMDVEIVEEFFMALCTNAGITLHINIDYGNNNHHMIEAVFKAFARALREAISIDDKVDGVPSTKGIL
ncbi:MAG: imidazoleglycerol-phosphate dehydratase HisB [Clostridiales bacterium]|nr:imidazoleglycerol-phosphate dehydratase HisB [Clostridiales bacterium]